MAPRRKIIRDPLLGRGRGRGTVPIGGTHENPGAIRGPATPASQKKPRVSFSVPSRPPTRAQVQATVNRRKAEIAGQVQETLTAFRRSTPIPRTFGRSGVGGIDGTVIGRDVNAERIGSEASSFAVTRRTNRRTNRRETRRETRRENRRTLEDAQARRNQIQADHGITGPKTTEERRRKARRIQGSGGSLF